MPGEYMHFEILVEDMSGKIALDILIPKIIDQEFLDGTSPRIYPWNQSKISNLKSSSPRIYPWGQSKI